MSSSFITPRVRNAMLGVIFVVVLYAFFINGISANPPGFYVDESCIAYNAYLISQTGYSESGQHFPILYQCYTQCWTQWVNAESMYLLAGMYTIISPSVISARIFAATWVFLTVLLLGYLAYRISGKTSVAIIVVLSAAVTPWIFEYGRFVMEQFFLLFSITAFLFVLYNASLREKWRPADVILITATITMITYCYATGRVIGPLFALGLLIFAVNMRALLNVIAVWVIFGLTMIPFVVMYVQDPLRVSGRFLRATNMSRDNSVFQNIGAVISAFYQDLSLNFFIIDGDHLPRHHVPDTGVGEFLIGTFILGLIGLAIIFIWHRSSKWWRYIVYGLVASLIPGAVTIEHNHSLRDIAFPIFFLVLLVPALSWLMGFYKKTSDRAGAEPHSTASGKSVSSFISPVTGHYLRYALLTVLLVITAVQAVQFQVRFRESGGSETRKAVFHASYPDVLARAFEQETRPIYLQDFGEPVYMLALWYGAVWGYDSSNFVHLLDRQNPPEGAVVLTSKGSCTECQVIYQNTFLLYRNQAPDMSQTSVPVPANPVQAPSVFNAGPGNLPAQLSGPRGIAVDPKGNIYVADTGNSRIQKFDPDGKFLIEFGKDGPTEVTLKSPNGIAVDAGGAIYVVDVGSQRLVKFNADGTFAKSYEGPDTGFYGPRDVAIGSNKQLYVVDQGRSRIAAFELATGTYGSVWGTPGTDPAQFKEATGIAVSGDLVFVTDLGNRRIQIFDLSGNFVHEWPITQLTGASDEYPDVTFDEKTKTVYVSSSKTNEVLAFDVDGNPRQGFNPQEEEKLEAPTSLAIAEVNKKRWLYVLNTGSSKISRFPLDSPEVGKVR